MSYFGYSQVFGPIVTGKIKQVEGEKNLPSAPPFIIAANHVGFLDSPALVMYMLHKYNKPTWFFTTPVMWKLFGGDHIARKTLAMIPIHPENKKDSLSEAIKLVQQGETVGVFPEGHRNPDINKLIKGKTGAVRLALATNVPLIPVGVFNNTGHFFREVLMNVFKSNRFITLTFGQPLDLSEFKNKPIDKPLLEVATKKLMLAIAQLCHKEYSY